MKAFVASLLGLGFGLGVMTSAAEASCRLALAVGLDISSSVDSREYRLQIEGLSRALASARVTEAILSPEDTHIAMAVYEWSGYQQQDMVLDWAILDSPDAITNFAARLALHKRSYAEFATALGKGVEYGANLLRRAPVCARLVLDIAGDGENNIGVDPIYFALNGALAGITVNGLVIRGATPDPAPYYQSEVPHGPGAFVVVANGFSDYRVAMEKKLLREIGGPMVLGHK